jgi:hypothetical protein
LSEYVKVEWIIGLTKPNKRKRPPAPVLPL